MFLELGAIGGAIGLWLARNTKPVKYVTNTAKGWFTKTKVGQSVILSNAKDTIKNEFNSEKEKLREDILDLEIDRKTFYKKQEYIQFLKFAISDESTSEQEKDEYKRELETKEGELAILEEALKQKEALIENRETALDSYQSNVLDKRISEAELAEVVFKQQNQVEKYEKDLENIEKLGDNSMTNNVVSRYAGGTYSDSKIRVARRYELLDKYRKNKGNEEE